MVPNPADKDACMCCSEPKPGSKPKAVVPPPSLGGTVTGSGFKFGGNIESSSSSTSTGFSFGSTSASTEVSKTPSSVKFGSSEIKTTEDTTKKGDF